jgi:hypothetical protein
MYYSYKVKRRMLSSRAKETKYTAARRFIYVQALHPHALLWLTWPASPGRVNAVFYLLQRWRFDVVRLGSI